MPRCEAFESSEEIHVSHMKEPHETLGLGRTTKTLGFNNGLKTLASEVMLKTQAWKVIEAPRPYNRTKTLIF